MSTAYYINPYTNGTSATTQIINTTTFVTTTSSATSNIIYMNNPGQMIVSGSPHTVGGGGSGYHQSIGKLKLDVGYDIEVTLPDDALISVKADGSYNITDVDGKIKYKGNPLREFNPYVNASDMLEEFVDFVASVGGVTKQSFLNLPIELFIRWLVIRAAEADGDDLPEDVSVLKYHPALLPPPKKHSAHCKCCGKFISKKRSTNSIFFCSTDHFEKFSMKIAV